MDSQYWYTLVKKFCLLLKVHAVDQGVIYHQKSIWISAIPCIWRTQFLISMGATENNTVTVGVIGLYDTVYISLKTAAPL